MSDAKPVPKSKRKRLLRWCGGLLAVGFVLFNAIAYMHARAMMHFSTDMAERTHEPEKLTVWQKAKVLVSGVKMPRPVNKKTPADFGMQFETANFVGAHGLKLEAWRIRRAESKGTVILFHGYTGCKDAMLEPAKEFYNLGYDTLLVDFYGSGGSAGNDTSVGYYEGDDVAAALKYVREDRFGSPVGPSAPVFLYGVSMGAAAILRAAHAHNIAPDGIILECPFDRLLTTVKNRFAAMHLPSFPAAHALVFWGGVQQGFNAFAYNPADYARDVHCPVLLMHGEKDARVHLDEMDNIVRNLNTNSVYKVFPGLAHQSYVTAESAKWREYVSEFLAKTLASESSATNKSIH